MINTHKNKAYKALYLRQQKDNIKDFLTIMATVFRKKIRGFFPLPD